jgi:RNA polymerase sigma factor (sigma-70 family)
MAESDKLARFEQIVIPHLDAAYNLARWLMRNEQDAEDAVQDAYLRAFRFFDTFEGGDGRPWLLAIVRNCCRTLFQGQGVKETTTEFDEQKHSTGYTIGTEERLLKQVDIESVRSCIEGLPPDYREVVILREIEELSYKEIAAAVAAPVGTVMSRLSRARTRLQNCLGVRVKGVRA